MITVWTQNEADNVHSVIKKSIKGVSKSGPIYIHTDCVRLFQSARKNGKSPSSNRTGLAGFLGLRNDLPAKSDQTITKHQTIYKQHKNTQKAEEWVR